MRAKADDQLKNFAASASKTNLTTSNGRPIETLTESMTVGPRGPIVLQDFTLIDSLAHFDRERIPERVVHAKGAGAFGYFECTTNDGSKYCKSAIFTQIGKRCPIGLRFSTVGGESASADTARDPRGFAVKFYTEEGNWDLVGNNTPIFFIRDPILFPSFIHTQKRNPVTHLKDADAFWDFISLRPETTHQVSFLFGPRGTPDGYRHLNGYGSHTFKNVNSKGEACWVKYHFKTDQGIRNLSPEKADELAGSDPDYATRDLFNAIANKDFPSWTVYLQVMNLDEAKRANFNPFDITKVWSHRDFPLIEVGRIVLNRNPRNYFAEIEQIAFAPANMIPGIEPSPDKMLQGRLFSYNDTHRHRLGANYELLPVNKPLNSSVNNNQRDGPMRCDDNQSGAPNYFPNSFSGPVNVKSMAWLGEEVASGAIIARYDSSNEDNFSQCGNFYRNVLSEADRDQLTSNIAGNLSNAQEFIQMRAIANFAAADADYGKRIAEKVAQIKGAVKSVIEQEPPAPLNPPRSVPCKGKL